MRCAARGLQRIPSAGIAALSKVFPLFGKQKSDFFSPLDRAAPSCSLQAHVNLHRFFIFLAVAVEYLPSFLHTHTSDITGYFSLTCSSFIYSCYLKNSVRSAEDGVKRLKFLVTAPPIYFNKSTTIYLLFFLTFR